MKKLVIHVSLIAIFILTFLLQTIFFNHFTIAGVKPNIFIILMLYIGLYMGRSFGISYGIIYGIFLDVWIGKRIGITSVCLALIGLLGGIFDKNFSKDSRMTIILMGIVSTAIYEIALYILRYLILGINIETIEFLRILFVEIIYNVLIIIILYPLMKLTGYEIEDEIKGDKILTRYF